MPPRAGTGTISADASLTQAKKNEAYFKRLLTAMPMHEGMSSVREADYKGHHIVVETSYKITIDGKRFQGTLGVTDGGYHGMPNVGFASALDPVKAVIDTFPEDFSGDPGDPGHGHDHDHHGHGGMTMTPRARTSARPPARASTGTRQKRRQPWPFERTFSLTLRHGRSTSRARSP